MPQKDSFLTTLRYRASQEKVCDLDCVLVLPEDDSGQSLEPVALGVFCHGFGAGGDDLVGLANDLLQIAGADKPIALVFPAAPIALDDQGMPGARAWWLLSIQRLLSAMEDGRYEQVREEVPEGIEDARQKLTDTTAAMLDRFSLNENKLLLGGFSQGAMLSVETACLGLENPPSKLCLFSGALICERRWKSSASRLANTQILQSHGKLDPILPPQTGVWLKEMLVDGGATVEFIEFNGPHTIPYDALEKTGVMLASLVG